MCLGPCRHFVGAQDGPAMHLRPKAYELYHLLHLCPFYLQVFLRLMTYCAVAASWLGPC